MTQEQKKEVNTLVKKISIGDIDATGTLYRLMYRVIFDFLRKWSYDEYIIDDAISMTFKIIIEKSYDKMVFVNCYSWILTISKNVIRNLIRKEQREHEIIMPEETTSNDNTCSIIDIKNEIKKLPKVEKHIIYYKYTLGYKFKEIAQILAISESTIRRKEKATLDYLKEKNDEEG